MNYAPRLSAEALRALAQLPPDLQEFALDEVERLVADPGLLVFRGTSDPAIHDAVLTTAREVHYVFLTVEPDHSARVLRIEAIGHFSRLV